MYIPVLVHGKKENSPEWYTVIFNDLLQLELLQRVIANFGFRETRYNSKSGVEITPIFKCYLTLYGVI